MDFGYFVTRTTTTTICVIVWIQGGTVILTTEYVVADDDAGDTSTFTLDCSTSTGYFAMNTSTGIISYSTDYDVDDGVRPTSVNCNVTVTDSTGLTDIATQTIAISTFLICNVYVISHS